MKKMILTTFVAALSLNATASDYQPDRSLAHNSSSTHQVVQRTERNPNDDLIWAVKGYKDGIALLVGFVMPLTAPIAALATGCSTEESDKDLAKIRNALRRGADVNYRDEDSWTALQHAAYGGYPRIVELLLQNGADKNLKVTKRTLQDWRGYDALKIAQYYLDRSTRTLNSSRSERPLEPGVAKLLNEEIERYTRIVNLLR